MTIKEQKLHDIFQKLQGTGSFMDVASRLAVSPEYLKRIEAGEMPLSDTLYERIVTVYKLKAEDAHALRVWSLI